MTVLLVDDQEKILEATEKLVNWDRLRVDTVYTANSAEAARKILSEKYVSSLVSILRDLHGNWRKESPSEALKPS